MYANNNYDIDTQYTIICARVGERVNVFIVFNRFNYYVGDCFEGSYGGFVIFSLFDYFIFIFILYMIIIYYIRNVYLISYILFILFILYII